MTTIKTKLSLLKNGDIFTFGATPDSRRYLFESNDTHSYYRYSCVRKGLSKSHIVTRYRSKDSVVYLLCI